MNHTHDYKWIGGQKDNKVFKTLKCSCGDVADVVIKEVGKQETKQEKSVWDKKDLRIGRMSVLKTASDIVIYGSKVDATCIEQEVIRVARVLEQYVYEED